MLWLVVFPNLPGARMKQPEDSCLQGVINAQLLWKDLFPDSFPGLFMVKAKCFLNLLNFWIPPSSLFIQRQRSTQIFSFLEGRRFIPLSLMLFENTARILSISRVSYARLWNPCPNEIWRDFADGYVEHTQQRVKPRNAFTWCRKSAAEARSQNGNIKCIVWEKESEVLKLLPWPEELAYPAAANFLFNLQTRKQQPNENTVKSQLCGL